MINMSIIKSQLSPSPTPHFNYHYITDQELPTTLTIITDQEHATTLTIITDQEFECPHRCNNSLVICIDFGHILGNCPGSSPPWSLQFPLLQEPAHKPGQLS